VRALAALGPRFATTDGDARGRAWVVKAMRAAGLRDVHEEPFAIPAYLPEDAGCVISGSRGRVDDIALRSVGLQSTAAGMVNLDALGPPLAARRTLIATPDIARGARDHAAATGWHPEQTLDATAFPFTDHAPFAAAGIPTALLWRWPPPHPAYHSAGDTPDGADR
jgi:hypothetical protein